MRGTCPLGHVTEIKPAATSSSSGSKSFFKSPQKGSGEISLDLPHSDVVQDLGVNKGGLEMWAVPSF